VVTGGSVVVVTGAVGLAVVGTTVVVGTTGGLGGGVTADTPG
jgi:hypothetical protein